MRHGRDGRQEWTARFAALLLVVQAVLLAFSTGATAAAPVRDQFGNVICAPGTMAGHDGSSSPHDRHGGGFDCCTVGCPMFGGLASAPAPDAPSSARPLLFLVRFALHENVAAAGVPPSPRNARAPPLPV